MWQLGPRSAKMAGEEPGGGGLLGAHDPLENLRQNLIIGRGFSVRTPH